MRRFWLEFSCSELKLRLFRFAFFAVFGIDACLQIAHAPRYGAGDFNVSHFPFLDPWLPMPTRNAMVLIYTTQCYLGFRLALGAASRWLYVGLAIVFSVGYFISQLNSYQHHYLLALALALVAMFPWPRVDAAPDTPEISTTEENWPIRMLLVSLSIMYLFAVVAKLDGEWTSGITLYRQLHSGWIRELCIGVGWGTAAKMTMAVEFALIFLLQIRRLWPLALLLGIGMHWSFESAGLEIGLFSYFMFTLYILVIPDRWLAFVGQWIPRISLRPLPIPYALRVGLPLVVATLLLWRCLPLLPGTISLVLLCIAGRKSLRHLSAACCLLAVLYSTNSIRDYHRFLGGELRRAGHTLDATEAYEQLVAWDPSYSKGYRSLGDLYRTQQRYDEAITTYLAGLKLAPKDYRLNIGAAQVYLQKRMKAETLRHSQRALSEKPQDSKARQLVTLGRALD